MQSGGGPQQGGGGGHRRSTAPSASASPSSSSSAAFDHQQQQRQALQQQFLRRTEGNNALLAYQAVNIHGALAGSNVLASGYMQLPQQSRKLIDLGQPHAPPNIQDQGHNRIQGAEQQVLNPFQHTYLQNDFQAAQQKSTLGMQSQQQMKPGISGPLVKDQDMRMTNIIQVGNLSQASTSKKSSEQVVHGEKLADHNQLPMSSEPRSKYPARLGQTMSSASMLGPHTQQNIMNMTNNPMAMAAQMQALQSLALEHNIDLSNPANANVIAQLIPLMQSRMFAQQKANESNISIQPASFAKPNSTSMQVASKSSPPANSSSDVSGQSGSSKVRQVLPSSMGVTSSTALADNSSNLSLQQSTAHVKDNQLTPRQPNIVGIGMPPFHPMQSPGNSSQGVESLMLAKASSLSEASQAQYARKANQSPQQSVTPSSDREVGNLSTPAGGPFPQMRQSHVGFTKQQLHVLNTNTCI